MHIQTHTQTHCLWWDAATCTVNLATHRSETEPNQDGGNNGHCEDRHVGVSILLGQGLVGGLREGRGGEGKGGVEGKVDERGEGESKQL